MAEYIDRRTALDALYDANAITYEGLDILEKIPAADVQPVKHGKFVNTKTKGICCSECGAIIALIFTDNAEYFREAIEDFNFCYSCGAKMDGGD